MLEIDTPILSICSKGHSEIVYKYITCPLCDERIKIVKVHQELARYKKEENTYPIPLKDSLI